MIMECARQRLAESKEQPMRSFAAAVGPQTRNPISGLTPFLVCGIRGLAGSVKVSSRSCAAVGSADRIPIYGFTLFPVRVQSAGQ